LQLTFFVPVIVIPYAAVDRPRRMTVDIEAAAKVLMFIMFPTTPSRQSN